MFFFVSKDIIFLRLGEDDSNPSHSKAMAGDKRFKAMVRETYWRQHTARIKGCSNYLRDHLTNKYH